MIAPPIRKLVIAGGGTAGWMAAAAFAKLLGPSGVTIELVESDAIGTVGVGEATIPPITGFNAMLGLDEDDFVRATQATYKLGIEFVDWTRPGHRYIHPFGDFGVDLDGIQFHHHWLRGRTLGVAAPLEAYSLACAAARAGRFMRAAKVDNSPLSRITYAFQFDAGLYALHLRRYAEVRGVVRTEGRITHVEQDGRGHVTTLHLDAGRRVAGELFIDCSGFRGLLIGEALGTPYVDWSAWLPCDRAVAVPCQRVADPVPLTRSTARAAGWQWRIPLQHRTGNGYVYSSAHLSDDEAVADLMGQLDGEAIADPRHLRFQAGHRAEPWRANVVALGLAAGFLEPLESTSIHLVQTGIQRLLTLFPRADLAAADRDAFNRATVAEYTHIRDFLVYHYRTTERRDTPFWRERAEIPVPDSLARKLELWTANARLIREATDLFGDVSWLAVLDGQGAMPAAYSPLADAMSSDMLASRLANIAEVVCASAAAMPAHSDFLAGRRIPLAA